MLLANVANDEDHPLVTQNSLVSKPDTTSSAKFRNYSRPVYRPTGVSGGVLSDRVTISGYGNINYTNYITKEYDPYQKNRLDLEKFALYFKYRFTDWLRLSSEIEFEHGGTGATMEFDTIEEAGEFEMEIEKGGEVVLEHLYLDFLLHPMINVRAGRVKLHMGLVSSTYRPTHTFTVKTPEGESEMIPSGWYETGIQLYGGFFNKKLTYELSLTSGLDNSAFSGRNWIRNGHQTRFEMPVAEALAYSLRMDYHFGKFNESFAGFSAFFNNTTPNRPKLDMKKIDGWVSVLGAHLGINEGDLRFNAGVMWGYLQNSGAISYKNANLSKFLNVKRTAVGEQALAISAEVGYNVLPLMNTKTEMRLLPFVRYDYYDTMFKVDKDVTKMGLHERSVWSTGFNWFITPNVVLKAQYTDRTFGVNHFDLVSKQDTGRRKKEREALIGIGFSF